MSLNKSQKELLNILEKDSKKNKNKLYDPGPYWNYKAKKILYWLKKNGLDSFRGLNSGVGTSYSDNIVNDIRFELGFKGRLMSKLFSLPFFNTIFNLQVKLNYQNILTNIKYENAFLEKSERVKYLISKYKIENSVSFGCIRKINYNNKLYSSMYLDFIDRIDYLNGKFDFSKIGSLIELGGGFGGNIHLLVQNFKNLKKIIYVDMFPNIFVGTEYLKSHYGNSVKDYLNFYNSSEITFEKNDNLEIICIPNWALNKVKSRVDKFHNAASFQEMTIDQVLNYKNLILKILNKNQISIIIYKGWEKNNSLNTDAIQRIFDNNLEIVEFKQLSKSENLIYLFSN